MLKTKTHAPSCWETIAIPASTSLTSRVDNKTVHFSSAWLPWKRMYKMITYGILKFAICRVLFYWFS